jgi:phage gpG-like protein
VAFEIEGLAELRAEFAAMLERTQNLEPALLRAGLVPLKAAMDRIDAGGPGWPPNKTHTPLLHRTGRLLSSLTVGASDNVVEINGNSIVVGTNVRYAVWLQDGTRGSIRARKQNQIASRLGGAGFLSHSGAERSGGLPPRRFLFIDGQVAERVSNIFAAYVMGRAQGAA